MSLPAYPYTLPDNYASRTNRVLVGKTTDEVALYDLHLRDAVEPVEDLGLLRGQGRVTTQSTAGDIARLILGFIPVVGDAVDGLEQLYNAAVGKQVDPVIAVLSAAGLALDLGTGGTGDVAGLLKGAYRGSLLLAKQGGGVIAMVIKDEVGRLTTGRISPRLFIDTLKPRFGKLIQFGSVPGCGLLGKNCIPQYDRLAKALQGKFGLQGRQALTKTDELLDDVRYRELNLDQKSRLDDLEASVTCLRALPSGGVSTQANICPRNVIKDSVGRVTQVDAVLDKAYLNGGTAPTKAARDWTRKYGAGNDDAGHILARILGGPGGLKSENIVPILSRLNRGGLSQLEQRIAGWVSAGDAVSVNIKLKYADPAYPNRPSEIEFVITRNGVTSSPITYSNPTR